MRATSEKNTVMDYWRIVFTEQHVHKHMHLESEGTILACSLKWISELTPLDALCIPPPPSESSSDGHTDGGGGGWASQKWREISSQLGRGWGGGVCRSAYNAKMDPCHTFCCICRSGTLVIVICDGSIHSILLLANLHLCYKACWNFLLCRN